MRAFGRLLASVCVAVVGLSITSVPAVAAVLPDGRVYEAVSPVGTGVEPNVFVPDASAKIISVFGEHGVLGVRPFVAASNGEAVVYAGEPPATGGDGAYGLAEGNSFVARRSAGGGWTSTDLQRPEGSFRYMAFSDDLLDGRSERLWQRCRRQYVRSAISCDCRRSRRRICSSPRSREIFGIDGTLRRWQQRYGDRANI